ncbi:oligosaccharide flippase family protein [Algibacter amylolyticus]|uniref:Oligosaccharide flippase family protein n=1 Tax=Algibacter amylolyticus TaxID=1608400 RepID=A0A5M7BDB8_9FLAO|nr:polysaccharide biosynthesis C-terminal domain-containing protein [Algibacter amylolyticus]KAA5827419.1 oligosaccharide flippase family protein [Algibacter amylolyticus]MBB5266611.1 O-antigen/teichoic acid export membrane protein [Algibacter amylolyticus]TSJ81664.1 oligosaccharide flippase family protein [Algibacter amylolyticus]
MGKLKNILLEKKGYFFYVLGEGLSKGIVFLLLGFYTNIFDKNDFGKLSLFWISVPLLSIFLDLSQRSYVKHVSIHSKNEALKLIDIVKYFSTMLLAILLLSFVIKGYFGVYIIDEKGDYYLLLCAFLYSIIELHLFFYQLQGEVRKYNIIFVLKNTLPYILSAIIILLYSNSIYAFMNVQLILYIGLVIWLSRGFSSFKKLKHEGLTILKASLKFSLPFIPSLFSALALGVSDRYIIKYFYSDVELAEYTVAYTVSSIFMAFYLATNKMFQKTVLENLKLKKFDLNFKLTKKYIFVILILGIFISLIKKYMVLIMSNESYLVILDIIPTIILGMFFYFLYSIVANIPFFFKDTKIMVIPAIFAAILNLVLNFILVPKYGYKIAALTTTISYAVEFLVMYLLCLKKYKIDVVFNIKFNRPVNLRKK